MAISLKKLRRAVMGFSPEKATSFSEGNTPLWRQLETAVLSALAGYHATLDNSKFEVLVPELDKVDLGLRSYAYEGAAMGLTGFDCFFPWKNRLKAYMAGPGAPHIYMVHIGAGEALALLRRKPEPFIERLEDRVICWLVMDGYGFNNGFFHRKRYVERQRVPKHLSPYGRRIFDQGLGRSIFFTDGAKVERVASTIAQFPQARQADLWLGVGVGCTYVGGLDRTEMEALRTAAGPYSPQMAVGAAFVAKGRKLAGNPVSHTETACEVFCGLTADQAAQLTDRGFENLPIDGPEPAFEILQQRLLVHFTETVAHMHQPKEALQ